MTTIVSKPAKRNPRARAQDPEERSLVEFNRLIADSELHFVDKCCHAPMMEHPQKFNVILEQFLAKHTLLEPA